MNAGISVERLRELLAKATPGPWRSYRASKYWHLRNEAGDYVMEACQRGQVRQQSDAALIAAMHEALPALLHQLAELEQKYRESCDITRDWIAANNALSARAEAAERARDDARKELDSAMHEIAGLSPNGYADSYVDRIAAFLAASGGA